MVEELTNSCQRLLCGRRAHLQLLTFVMRYKNSPTVVFVCYILKNPPTVVNVCHILQDLPPTVVNVCYIIYKLTNSCNFFKYNYSPTVVNVDCRRYVILQLVDSLGQFSRHTQEYRFSHIDHIRWIRVTLSTAINCRECVFQIIKIMGISTISTKGTNSSTDPGAPPPSHLNHTALLW